MLTEIKLFILTRYLMTLFREDKNLVVQLLDNLLNYDGIHPNFWAIWMERYDTLIKSKAVQISLLRAANFPYSKIQETLGVSPSTISKVSNSYSLDYGELEGTKELKVGLTELEKRMKKAGIKLW